MRWERRTLGSVLSSLGYHRKQAIVYEAEQFGLSWWSRVVLVFGHATAGIEEHYSWRSSRIVGAAIIGSRYVFLLNTAKANGSYVSILNTGL